MPLSLDATVTILWVVTPVMATVSLVNVCIAMTTNHWLHTDEKMQNARFNGTGDKYLSKCTFSGLWTLCFINPGEHELNCTNVDYFPKEEYSPDPNDSTMAIPYAVTRSAAFYILATFFLFIGEFFCFFGHFGRKRRIFTFISGIIFIISGLFMLIGLVMYISIFKAEVGGKLRPKTTLEDPIFQYHYGFSFLLVVSGFMSTEMAGTCAIFLYIYWHQKDWSRKQEKRKMAAVVSAARHPDHSILPPPVPPPTSMCKKHLPPFPPPVTHRRYSWSSRNSGSVDASPRPSVFYPTPFPYCKAHGGLFFQERCNNHLYPPLLPPLSPLTSHSVRDLSYFSFPLIGRGHSLTTFSRDDTSNTVSTEVPRDFTPSRECLCCEEHQLRWATDRKREFSFEALRRTTPV